MVEEVLVARAEVVEARLAVRRRDEAILGTASVAGEADVALAAVPRQGVALVEPELPLPLGGDELEHVRLPDVPELVAGLDEMVARVEVARVLERERQPTGLGVD